MIRMISLNSFNKPEDKQPVADAAEKDASPDEFSNLLTALFPPVPANAAPNAATPEAENPEETVSALNGAGAGDGSAAVSTDAPPAEQTAPEILENWLAENRLQANFEAENRLERDNFLKASFRDFLKAGEFKAAADDENRLAEESIDAPTTDQSEPFFEILSSDAENSSDAPSIESLRSFLSDAAGRESSGNGKTNAEAKSDAENAGEFASVRIENLLTRSVSETDADKTRPAAANSEMIFSQVETRLRELALFTRRTERTDILRFRLRPAELGAVEIKLEKTDTGALVANIQTETEAASRVLGERLGELRESLQEAGWRVEQVQISSGLAASTGGDHSESRPQPFQTENRPTGSQPVEAVSQHSNDSKVADSNRLVNLRA